MSAVPREGLGSLLITPFAPLSLMVALATTTSLSDVVRLELSQDLLGQDGECMTKFALLGFRVEHIVSQSCL